MSSKIIMTQTSEFTYSGEASIVHKPFIELQPLPFNTSLLRVQYDWVIFSSKNAVKFFVKYFPEVRCDKVAVIGEKTKATCEAYGIPVHFCPQDYSQEGFLEQFETRENDKILIPSSSKARPNLVETLRARLAEVVKIDLYQPNANTKAIGETIQYIQQHQVLGITFASSSAVRALMSYINRHHIQITLPRLYVIGSQTLRTLNTYGIDACMAEKATLEALVEKVIEESRM